MVGILIVALRRASLLFGAVALALYAPRASAATPGFTLDSILAAPFVDNLATSAQGDGLGVDRARTRRARSRPLE